MNLDLDLDLLDCSPSPRKRRKALPMVSGQSIIDFISSWGAVKPPNSVPKIDRSPSGYSLRTSQPEPYAQSLPTSPNASMANPDFEPPSETQEELAAEQPVHDSEDEPNSSDVIQVLPRRTLVRQVQVEQVPRGRRELPARSTRAKVSYVRPVTKKGVKTKKLAKRSNQIPTSDTMSGRAVSMPKAETARKKVRHGIAQQTKRKRDAFLLANRQYFLPLLPDNSYIHKLQRVKELENIHPKETVYRELTLQPEGVKAIMKPYQLSGLSFLVYMYENGMSCILGDEMGLGKTLQTLSLFQYMAEHHPTTGEHRPYLVVCPLSVLSSWIAESKKWVPGLKVARFHGHKAERARLMKDCVDIKKKMDNGANITGELPDIIVTTYETFKAEQGWFKRAFVWRYCVLDEGHTVKNNKSDISSALQSLSAEYRLLLTGTPLQNNLQEMWALLHWLFPEVFALDTEEKFRHAFDLTKGNVSTTFMDNSRLLLELIMLRRMKSSPEVDLGLPRKVEVLLYVPLTPVQRFWYTRLLTRESSNTLNELFVGAKDKEARVLRQSDSEQLELLEKAGAALANADEVAATDVWAESRAVMQEALQTDEADQKTRGWQKLMNLLMQLRKVCNHPYLLPNAAPWVYDIGDHIIHASGKFIVLDKLLDELVIKQGKKVLIFSGFTRTLDLVGELLLLKGANGIDAPFSYARLDGRTSRALRNLSIRMFNEQGSEYKVMLLSTRAGGLGINLTSATEVVFMDEDWNPQATIQAEARAHRIGQTQNVTIYKLCSQGTVEEQMLGRIRKKLYLSTKITESMRNIHSGASAGKKRKRQSTNAGSLDDDDDAPHLDTASLQSLIRRGAQTLAHPEIDVTEMLSWAWETVLENCKDRPVDALVSEVQGLTKVDEQKWLNSMEKVETAIFEGKKHEKEMKKKAEAIAELNRSARRVGKNTTVKINGFMISKESMNCADWEAVPTIAGKDPRMAEPKREKREVTRHQDFCQTCWDSGELVLCNGCPRAYHRNCLTQEQKARSLGLSFYCSQHECRDCGAKTAEAGGLIFRCRWCECGFCEDCLDWTSAKRVGFTLPEFQTLGYGDVSQAYFVDCHQCVEHFNNTPDDRSAMEKEKLRYEQEYGDHLRIMELMEFSDSTSRAEKESDTISEAVTPANIEVIELSADDSSTPHSVRKKPRKF